MYILAIESSCDETSIALLRKNPNQEQHLPGSFVAHLNSYEVIASIISSQIETHAEFGGVIPEIGARLHAEQIHTLFTYVVQKAQSVTSSHGKPAFTPPIIDTYCLTPELLDVITNISTIMVTVEPGLVSALRVGMEFAKTLRYFIAEQSNHQVEIISVNHLQGHVASCFYQLEPTSNLWLGDDSEIFPHLHLLVSGGNSQLIVLNSWNDWNIVGQTLDDAAGECLDKIGRMIGLPYPAGGKIAKIAQFEDQNHLQLPVGMLDVSTLNYSFSGLKTAVRYHVQAQQLPGFDFEKPLTKEEIDVLYDWQNQKKLVDVNKQAKLEYIYKLCVSAQSVVTSQLVNKLVIAKDTYKPVTIGLSGGVSANSLLRRKIQQAFPSQDLYLPDVSLTGDNAIMIALAGIARQY